MPSNDALNLLHTAVPTPAVGVIAVAVSGVVAGGKGALGAGIGTLLAILFMGSASTSCTVDGKTLPQLFQAMGRCSTWPSSCLLLIFVALFKNTSLFNPRAFAVGLVLATVVWMAAQARAHMKAKILHVDPNPRRARSPRNQGPRREGVGVDKAMWEILLIVRCQLRHRGRGHLS